MRNRYLYITLLAVLGWNVETQGQTGNRQVPRLVVNITIDQLRSDYLEAFTPLYGNDGFKRLTEQGVVFAGAYNPHRHHAFLSRHRGPTVDGQKQSETCALHRTDPEAGGRHT